MSFLYHILIRWVNKNHEQPLNIYINCEKVYKKIDNLKQRFNKDSLNKTTCYIFLFYFNYCNLNVIYIIYILF